MMARRVRAQDTCAEMEMSQDFRDWLRFRDEGEKYHYVMPFGNLIAETV